MKLYNANPYSELSLFRRLFHLNWTLVLIVIVLSCIGFAMMYSAAEGSFDPWASRQIKRFALFLPVMIFLALIDIRIWLRYSYVAYGICLILLLWVELAGNTAMGATRWIVLGGLRIQPSELMKLCLIFALARYFHFLHSNDVNNPLYLIPPLLLTALPFVLIMKQPDLGTAIIIAMIGAMMFFAAGVSIWKFVTVGVMGLIAIPFAWKFLLHDYQKQRVLTFLDPESDPLGAGYNILQSKIAIGSGGFMGKGFLKGTQSQLSFLPEKQTDFIFTMLAEEFGFLGAIIVIALYITIILYGISIAVNCRNHFGRMMAIGITSMLFLHIFINIAMVMGMIPIVGAPLPFLSYGGTIMITVLAGAGMLLNVYLYRDAIIQKSIADDL